MDTQTGSTKKIAINYGLLLSLSTIALSCIVYALGLSAEQPWWQSALNFVFMIAFIVLGIKQYKQDNQGFLSLGEALKNGLAIALVAGIIGSIFTYIFVTYIEPDFVQQLLEVTEEKMIDSNPNMSDEQIEMALTMTEKMMSPTIMTAIGIIASLFFGFIVSLIAGLVMKQNRPV
ncbi:MAG: DUF4199 domain-containing protein [Bacteroidetes bacterium]|nr:DUF4199 domain-containing protein [Bacteroidota bacterium]